MENKSVKGEYLGHGNNGFTYRYVCPACKHTFESTAYELSEPTLCHSCYAGSRRTPSNVGKSRLREERRVDKKSREPKPRSGK